MRLRQNVAARSILVLAVPLMAALALAVKVAIGGERSSVGDPAALDRFMRGGTYRSAIPSLEQMSS